MQCGGVSYVWCGTIRRLEIWMSKYNYGSMTSGRIAGTLVVIAVFCVLTIFFFPAMQGPYSVVHGPVTALLSIRAAAGLRMAIVRAGLSVVRSCLSFARLALVLLSSTAVSIVEFATASLPPGCDVILRC